MKNIKFVLLIYFTITSCAGLGEAKKVLKNEKTFSTDEFLVKKKEPLTLPPDFDKLPLPNSSQVKKRNENDNQIKEILKTAQENSESSKSTSTLEDSILEKIK